ncbi:MAG: CoA pyrophosphatase [Bacteroidales bacterium]|nr:CoA pyrophosphatase [Bacteroidales bacterium]HOI32412.1 CoA pyrophosphatase [Bacteroidales bacterium]
MNLQLPPLKHLSKQIHSRLLGDLPGTQAHQRMEPVTRKAFLNIRHAVPPRQSAVLILLFEENGKIKTPFIKRNIYDGVHSGQIALPGGGFEKHDNNLINTALRETEEEIGIAKDQIKVLGSLSKIYIPPSNFDVLPVVGYLENTPEIRIDPTEVSEAFLVDLEHLLLPGCVGKSAVKLQNGTMVEIPCYQVAEYTIWGATAMILSEFIEIISPNNPK